ncbi:hypothetical protein TNCV_428671 [Trichonephila clavipes]|nr:hypothetical protein TNCV_428671 [Trichonephila clavipes]
MSTSALPLYTIQHNQKSFGYLFYTPRRTTLNALYRLHVRANCHTTSFTAATVVNAVTEIKKCGIENHNPLVLSEHDFAASKATDLDAVGDETENNSAKLQILVIENELL